jgi:transposase
MNILPAKNYTPLSTLNQLCLPMNVGVLIPSDDSVRLLVFVLKQLDLTPLYEAYSAYRERRRREQADRERKAAERDAGKLAVADEAERKDTQPGRRAEKKKDGRTACDIVVALSILLCGDMEHSYSSRALAKADRQNINFMWLLQGNRPPSHGMINAFRKH